MRVADRWDACSRMLDPLSSRVLGGPCAGMLLAVLLLAATRGEGAEAVKEQVDFNRDVRPILADACWSCHGPDDKQRKAQMRLDTQEGVLGELRSGGRAVVPGQPEKSELFLRITTTKASQLMPPPKTGKQLTTAQKELLRRWIDQGAAWSRHWAFIPPQRPALPRVKNEAGVRNPIDTLVRWRLEREGLAPAPEADRVTLLRRLNLDLIGLPPTPAEVDAFLADRSPDVYEKQVERLLQSPHYGERWGRHWLDGARYADSDGYEKDKPRFVWAYRDWVIQALNRDIPYDRFIVEQLAGDLLPSLRKHDGGTMKAEEEAEYDKLVQDRRVATGFLRNSMINEEGGIDPEQFRMEAMFDRMDAIGKSMLGLTLQCAQCHNHKYDPLTQVDYYRLFAFINDTHEANIPVYTPAAQRMRGEIFRRIREIEADLQHRHPDWPKRMSAWEESVQPRSAGGDRATERTDQPAWQVVRPELDASGGQKHYLLADGSILAQGYAPTKHTTEFTVKTGLAPITAVRLELLNDPNLPLNGPGRSIHGLFALTEFRVVAAPTDKPGQKKEVKIVRATADVNPPQRDLDVAFDDRTKRRRITGPIAFAIDGKDDTAWSIDAGPGRSNVPRKAVFVFESPIAFPGGTMLTFRLAQNHGGWNSDDNQNNNLGRFRFSLTTAPDVQADRLPQRVREALAVPREQRTPGQTAAIFGYWRTTVPEWKEANARIEELWRQHPQSSSQLTLQARSEPRTTHLLERGDFLKPRQAVTPGLPGFLHSMPADAPVNRLTFARWLVDRNSPTTARALVNRVWQAYFGIGLVSTSEDLGTQGEPPVHPELLDWLAVEFMERGWSLKTLHRLIVTSATYRQTAQASSASYARDPENRLLSRGARFRVEAEVVRDIALAASGLLNPQVGGPSVYPTAPAFLFVPPASYGPKVWKEETGPNRYRRAVYTFRFRSVPYPMLQTFDAPNGDFACVRRVRSNTPLQALTTLNEPVFMECARALAGRTVHEGGRSDAERLTWAFRCCVSRQPTEPEAKLLLALLEDQTRRFAAGDRNPWELAADNPEKPPQLPPGVTPAQLAAWTAVARVLLNLDETITRE